MKMKKLMIAALATAMTLGSVMTASAAWVQEGMNWKWQNANGTYQASSWLTDGGRWYHFDQNAKMQRGWLLDTDGKWYFLDFNGVMQTGLIKVDDNVYFMDEHGALYLGDRVINGQSYNFGLYGTTNGKPFVESARTYGGNGNQTIISTGGGSTNNGTPAGDKVGETTKAVKDKAADVAAKHDSVSAIDVPEPTVESETAQTVDVKVTTTTTVLDDAAKADVKAAVKEVATTALSGATSVTYNGVTMDAATVKAQMDDLLDNHITQEALDNGSVTIGIVVDGVTITYDISLNK